MAKYRNWHSCESKANLSDLQSISVVWGAKSIKLIARNTNGKKMNIILSKDEAITLITRMTTGVHRIL